MHLWQIADPGRDYHRKALLLITVGFASLTCVALVVLAVQSDREKRKKTSRMFAAMCSALLAISFVHFGFGHSLHAWSSESAVHHAGIPLALFVLLRDDRFVLLVYPISYKCIPSRRAYVRGSTSGLANCIR
jgi:hypothetical protein